MRAAMTANDNAAFEELAKKVEGFDQEIAREERMAEYETQTATAAASLPELRQYSILRALSGYVNGKMDGLEGEVAQQLAANHNETRGFRIPLSALAETRAEITAAANPANANQAYGPYIPRLVADSVILKAGATVLDGLGYGKILLPTQTGGPDANIAWLAESGSAPLGDATFGSIALTPHTAGVYMKISRRALITNSIGLDALVRADTAAAIGRAIDQALLGTGSTNAPTGIRGLVAATTTTETDFSLAAADLLSAIETANGEADTFVISHAIAAAARKFRTTDKLPVPLATLFYGKNVLVSNLLAGNTILAIKASDVLVGFFNKAGAASVDVTVDTATYSSEGALKLALFSDVDGNLKHGAGSAAWLDLA
jgi:HK97 family phage major capsid protein